MKMLFILFFALLFISCSDENYNGNKSNQTITLLNVSYDPTREMYQDINKEFSAYWKNKTGSEIIIKQSHGGSGKQARSVIDGLEADVVTLALAYDIEAISEKSNLIVKDWQNKFPNNSSPYTSAIVLLVRKGNPKQIKDWDDLAKKGVSIITPNPKTSGGARWNYLALWAYAENKFNNDENKIEEFISKILKNVPIFDAGARGATNTFVQREMGDVLIAWENEALLISKELGKDKFEIIYPSITILAQPPVAIVDKVVDKKGTRKAAEEYLNFLYSDKAQEIMAKHFYRPNSEKQLQKYNNQFLQTSFVMIDKFNGWKNAHQIHFKDGGTFDKILTKAK